MQACSPERGTPTDSEIYSHAGWEREGEGFNRQFLRDQSRQQVACALEASTETIAIKLGISAQAVEEHRDSLIKKIGLLFQAELTKLGVQLGLIQAG